MEKTYPTLAIANWFIKKAIECSKPITPMKAQKLVYFAHGWCLAAFGRPLVNETVEAWRWGPVFKDLYSALRSYGRREIKELILSEDQQLIELLCPDSTSTEPEIVNADDTETLTLLDGVWDTYGELTAIQLSNMTHTPGSPWETTWSTGEGRRNLDIPDSNIKDYFAAILGETSNEQSS